MRLVDKTTETQGKNTIENYQIIVYNITNMGNVCEQKK